MLNAFKHQNINIITSSSFWAFSSIDSRAYSSSQNTSRGEPCCCTTSQTREAMCKECGGWKACMKWVLKCSNDLKFLKTQQLKPAVTNNKLMMSVGWFYGGFASKPNGSSSAKPTCSHNCSTSTSAHSTVTKVRILCQGFSLSHLRRFMVGLGVGHQQKNQTLDGWDSKWRWTNISVKRQTHAFSCACSTASQVRASWHLIFIKIGMQGSNGIADFSMQGMLDS